VGLQQKAILLIKDDFVYIQKDTKDKFQVKFYSVYKDKYICGFLPKNSIKREEIKTHLSIEEDRRREYIRNNYFRIGLFKDDILKGNVQIGMSREMVKATWGEPENINRTVGSWGVHEQWIYGNTYLYFENNILTSFQD
jgi:hypothetical protein